MKRKESYGQIIKKNIIGIFLSLTVISFLLAMLEEDDTYNPVLLGIILVCSIVLMSGLHYYAFVLYQENKHTDKLTTREVVIRLGAAFSYLPFILMVIGLMAQIQSFFVKLCISFLCLIFTILFIILYVMNMNEKNKHNPHSH